MKFTGLVFLASITLTVWSTAPAIADDSATDGTATGVSRQKTISAVGAAVVPMSDWGDAAGVGFGPLIGLDVPIQERVVVTGRAGYLHHLSKSQDSGFGGDVETSTSEIPILGGAKYLFGERGRFYAGGELGLVIIRARQEFMDESESDSDTELGMTLGAGWTSGKLDIRGNFFFPDIGEIGDATGLMLSAGYSVSAL